MTVLRAPPHATPRTSALSNAFTVQMLNIPNNSKLKFVFGLMANQDSVQRVQDLSAESAADVEIDAQLINAIEGLQFQGQGGVGGDGGDGAVAVAAGAAVVAGCGALRDSWRYCMLYNVSANYELWRAIV
jgi:hypothetical protein